MVPPEYPTSVETTPSRLPNRASGPQNQPMAKVAVSRFACSVLSMGGIVIGPSTPFPEAFKTLKLQETVKNNTRSMIEHTFFIPLSSLPCHDRAPLRLDLPAEGRKFRDQRPGREFSDLPEGEEHSVHVHRAGEILHVDPDDFILAPQDNLMFRVGPRVG